MLGFFVIRGMVNVNFDFQQFEELMRKVVREEMQRSTEAKKEKLYTVRETCAILRVSEKTLSRMEKSGKIRAVRVTGRPTYSQEEINRIKGI